MSQDKTSTTPVALTILLKSEVRNKETAAIVERIAADMGLQLTIGGVASVCFRVEPGRLEDLFHVSPRWTPSRGPGPNDFGCAGGYGSEDLPIPETLQPYVESITIMAPPTRMR